MKCTFIDTYHLGYGLSWRPSLLDRLSRVSSLKLTLADRFRLASYHNYFIYA